MKIGGSKNRALGHPAAAVAKPQVDRSSIVRLSSCPGFLSSEPRTLTFDPRSSLGATQERAKAKLASVSDPESPLYHYSDLRSLDECLFAIVRSTLKKMPRAGIRWRLYIADRILYIRDLETNFADCVRRCLGNCLPLGAASFTLTRSRTYYVGTHTDEDFGAAPKLVYGRRRRCGQESVTFSPSVKTVKIQLLQPQTRSLQQEDETNRAAETKNLCKVAKQMLTPAEGLLRIPENFAHVCVESLTTDDVRDVSGLGFPLARIDILQPVFGLWWSPGPFARDRGKFRTRTLKSIESPFHSDAVKQRVEAGFQFVPRARKHVLVRWPLPFWS